MRLVEVVFQLEDTAALRADVGAGLTDFPLRRLGGQALGDAAPAARQRHPAAALARLGAGPDAAAVADRAVRSPAIHAVIRHN